MSQEQKEKGMKLHEKLMKSVEMEDKESFDDAFDRIHGGGADNKYEEKEDRFVNRQKTKKDSVKSSGFGDPDSRMW